MNSKLMLLLADTAETVEQGEDFYDTSGNHCKLLGLAEDSTGKPVGLTVELLDRPDWTESPVQTFDWASTEEILGITVLPFIS